MKKLIAMVLTLACFSVQAQKWGKEFGVNYVYANPVGGMGHIIARGNGAAMNFGLVKPDGRFAFGVDMSVVEYGRDKSRQQYEMEDGSFAPMDIIVSNSFVNVMAYSRWYLAVKGPVRPYLVGRLGYSGFSTDLSIYDPDDRDHCEPVDTDVLYSNGTWVAGAGAGAKFDMASVFRKLQAGKFYFETNFNFTQGGQVRYMSEDAEANHPHGNTPDSDHVYAKFMNTETLLVHEHHVGHLFRSPVQMTELQVGFSMNISR
jgi:opacity protein-like surface antigen